MTNTFSKQSEVELAEKLVNEAIDAILELESCKVFPHGLPADFSKTLARLRSEASIIEEIANNWN